MHPIGLLIVLVMLLSFAPTIMAAAFFVAVAFAVAVGAYEFLAATFAGFSAYGSGDHLRIGPPPPDSDRDPAYRSYYAGPVLLDYEKVLSRTFAQVWGAVVAERSDENGTRRKPWTARAWSVTRAVGSPYWKAFAVPAALAACAGLVAGVVVLFVLIGVTSLIFGLLLLVMVTGALIAGGLGRLVELGVLFVRGITIECQECHVRVTRPVYLCSNEDCRAPHRKLIPGLSGVLHRTCRCHTSLPVLLMLGKGGLQAQCADCGWQLPLKGLQAPTAHVPVIAGPAAGKSVYMHTAVVRLLMRADEPSIAFEFADARAKSEFERSMQLGVHHDPSKSVKTVVARPTAFTVYVGRKRSLARRLLYLYDPAGEISESADHLANAQFLEFTKGVVFVLDPFSLRVVRAAAGSAVLARVQGSTASAPAVLERFVEALRERKRVNRANRFDVPVAVVVTKADELPSVGGVGHPYSASGSAAGSAAASDSLGRDVGRRVERSAAVRDWLCDVVDSRHLVTSLENSFAAVSFFAVSYRDAEKLVPHGDANGAAPVLNDDPAAPLLWLLDRKGRA